MGVIETVLFSFLYVSVAFVIICAFIGCYYDITGKLPFQKTLKDNYLIGKL